jgi:hypothetical protein
VWTESRHDLDVLIGKSDIMLRIAFGSDFTTNNFEGFAIDDIWIGERSRKVLIEQFTNTGDFAAGLNCDRLNTIVNDQFFSQDVVDIQYHTNFPAADVMNDANPADPSARSLYYGVNTVPRTVMDGIKYNNNFGNTVADVAAMKRRIVNRMLEDTPFDIKVTAELTGNVLDANAEVTALTTMSNVSVYLVVIEDTVNIGPVTHESVLRRMLPNAAGRNFPNSWGAFVKEDVSYSWTIEDIDDTSQIEVVAFVQDNVTKEVYQVATSDTTAGISVVGVSDQPLKGSLLSFIVFPNPANDHLNILFNNPLSEETNLEVYNAVGTLIHAGTIAENESKISLSTHELADGMYLMKITNASGTSFRKFVVNH